LEIQRGGVSYTVDTLHRVGQQHSGAELFFLMGGDSLRDLPTWRQPERICQLATPVVVRRNGAPVPDLTVLSQLVTAERLAQIDHFQVEMPIIQLSSTDLRQRVANGQSIRYRTPRAVEKYIETHNLYREEQQLEDPHLTNPETTG
jgi:nicotinate-nucleotide adenylyltransferase